MNYRASRVTRVTLDANRIIGAGATITVFYILVANSTSSIAEVDIQDGDSKNRITVVVPPNSSVPVEVEWIADNGLVISGLGNANVFVTIFHSAGGA